MACKQFIADLEPGDSVKSHFAVVKKTLRQFRNKEGQFLALTLSDRTGVIGANLWDNADNAALAFDEGDIVFLSGVVEEYQGKKQFSVKSIERADSSKIDLSDFLPVSLADKEALLKEFKGTIASIGSDPLRTLLSRLYDDDEFIGKFMATPGAKALHHARIGGLAEHVASSLEIARTVCDAHPDLDRDLVLAGIMLHDIGKLWELECGAVISYSVQGRLLGHISLGFDEVARRTREMPDFPADLRTRLLHIILSHHGAPEHGSPVKPMTAEAMAVHVIENCDAQVSQFTEKISAALEEGKQFTEFDALLERYLYAGGSGGGASNLNDKAPGPASSRKHDGQQAKLFP